MAVPARSYMLPRLSPDGRRVAVAITEQETHIWLYDFSREAWTRLTFEGNVNSFPVWTPDGKRIAFHSSKEGSRKIFWQLSDGSGGLERLRLAVPPCTGILVARREIASLFRANLRRAGHLGAADERPQGAAVPSDTVRRSGATNFPRTGAGWPIFRTNRAATKFTCSPILAPEVNGRSRPKAAPSQCGIPTGGSCSTATAIS